MPESGIPETLTAKRLREIAHEIHRWVPQRTDGRFDADDLRGWADWLDAQPAPDKKRTTVVVGSKNVVTTTVEPGLRAPLDAQPADDELQFSVTRTEPPAVSGRVTPTREDAARTITEELWGKGAAIPGAVVHVVDALVAAGWLAVSDSQETPTKGREE